MTALTRSPYEDDREGRRVYFRDVWTGLMGNFTGGNQWGWSLGFHPGMEVGPRGHHGASAITFAEARAGFEAKWKIIEPTLTKANFDAWRSATGRRGSTGCGSKAARCRGK